MTNLEAFVAGYLECLLWSSMGTDQFGDEVHLDDFFMTDACTADCTLEATEFYTNNLKLLTTASTVVPWENLGHDFALTRNHHGSGFWDRGLGDLGDKLTDAAHAEGCTSLCLNSDDEVEHI